MKVLGCKEQTGEYQGRKYHNYLIYVAYPRNGVIGVFTDYVKIKAKSAEDIFGVHPFDIDTLKMYIGSDINVAYDKYGQVISVDLIDEPEKAAV